MSDAPALVDGSSNGEALPRDGGRWLLDVKASRAPLLLWTIFAWAFMLPFMTACTGMLAALMIWVLATQHGPGLIAVVVMFLLVVPVMAMAVWVVGRMSLGMWRCLRAGRPAVRADAETVEAFSLLEHRWERMAWEEVGSVGVIQGGALVIEPLDVPAWLKQRSTFKRWQSWVQQRKHGVTIAMGFGMPMEEPVGDVMRKLAALRDARHAGLAVTSN